jgi:mannitol/fructose-specific phosphotransferase system IIA component (Ntr-type)
LLAATSDHEHLRVLARVSRIVNDEQWLARLRAASGAREARALVLARDAEIGR